MLASRKDEFLILAERSEYLLREFTVQKGLLPAEMKLMNPNLACEVSDALQSNLNQRSLIFKAASL